jgi:hypothetical protein
MPMRPGEIASRLTGFSTPLGGVSFKPAISDRDVARRVITFLEDRRALFAPYTSEVQEHVVISVQEIRAFITDLLGTGGIATELAEHLRAIRAACRSFLEDTRVVEMYIPEEGPRQVLREGHWGFTPDIFNEALGRLRATAGIHIGQIAVRYGLEVEDEMASILPPLPREDD